MAEKVGKVVLPGDTLEEVQEKNSKQKIIIGPGLRRDGQKIYVTKCGILRQREPCVFWVDCQQKRYIPAKGDNVVGVVMAKQGDYFRVDIGGSSPASLSYLAFEGATKRNRPILNVGDLVYAKLLVANKDCEPELVCIDHYGKASGLGILPSSGFVFSCSIYLVRNLLSADSDLLKLLGRSIQYEIAIGMNGRIWLQAKTAQETIALTNAICVSELMNKDEVLTLCMNVIDNIQRL